MLKRLPFSSTQEEECGFRLVIAIETPHCLSYNRCGRPSHASLLIPACKHGAVELNTYSMLWPTCYASYRKQLDKLNKLFPTV